MDTQPAYPESTLSTRLCLDTQSFFVENRLTRGQDEPATSQFPTWTVSIDRKEISSSKSPATSASTPDLTIQLEPIVSTEITSNNVDGHQTSLSFGRPNENNEGNNSSLLAQGNVNQILISSPTFKGTLTELVLDLDKLKMLCNDLYKQLAVALEENKKVEIDMANQKKKEAAAMKKAEKMISDLIASQRKATQSKTAMQKELVITTCLMDEYRDKANTLEARLEADSELTNVIVDAGLEDMAKELQALRVEVEVVKATLRQTQWRLKLAEQRLKREQELRKEATARTAWVKEAEEVDGLYGLEDGDDEGVEDVEDEGAEDVENDGDEEMVSGVN
ncbi:MAG: hypothetical protein Q9214_002016 [Letrouitia sp. 1 TL-2023]